MKGSMADMSGAPRVLIVEDNFLLLDMLTIQCERAGLTAVAASSGEDALTLLRTRGADFDWLLTDINLPGMIDGWTVALAFREVRPGRPVIYASTNAYFDRRPLRGSLSVRKPFQIREIAALARMMAAERGLSPALVSHQASA
jgi:CheY-like chemotaxis protein